MEEIITQRFNQIDKDIESLKSSDKDIYEKLGGKVGWKVYVWSFGILISLVLGMFSMLYYKLEEMSRNVSDINAQVSQIKGYLNGVNLEIK